MIKIELAEINDIDNIMKMINNCANDLISKNIFQWNEKYPSKDLFLMDIEKKNLFIFKNSSRVLGCVALSYDKDIEYNDIKWITKDDKNLYVHRLAVDPKFQKQGIGRLLMDFAEDYARDNKLKSVMPNLVSNVNHLNYALTWFFLSFALFIIFFIFFTKNYKKYE